MPLSGATGGAEPQDLVASFASCNGDPSFLFDWTAGKRTEILERLANQGFVTFRLFFWRWIRKPLEKSWDSKPWWHPSRPSWQLLVPRFPDFLRSRFWNGYTGIWAMSRSVTALRLALPWACWVTALRWHSIRILVIVDVFVLLGGG